MKPILEIQNISKKFRIGGDRSGYKTLRDSLFSGRGKKEDKGEFWALKDVSFDVFPGDSIGIIGKNGAGKSTLLKILSRITPPTKGKIICRGRVASLLEVGTGFHGELSGRENIYLNGSILGLKKAEINSKFDEIVDFSGVEKFLDTPLKHYSSGMQLRLAFAVAAHLEPEILIIDEVLAAGDAEFQKKCLGKMDEISKQQGRTILFVSHNLSTVESLCRKSLLLNDGKIESIGVTADVVNSYVNLINSAYDQVSVEQTFSSGKYIKAIKVFCDDVPGFFMYTGCKFEMHVEFHSEQILKLPILGLVVRDINNNGIIGINNKHYLKENFKQTSNGCFKVVIPDFPIYKGKYYIDIHLGDGNTDIETLFKIVSINVETRDFSGTCYLPNENFNRILIKNVHWELE